MDKDFVITGIKGIRFLDKNGNELPDWRDSEPVLQETKLDTPIIELILHHTTVPFEWVKEKPFCKYGYAYFGIGDGWEWYEDKLNEAPEIDLWKMYGLCNEYWYHQYSYWNHKHEKEFRDYRRSKGEDLNSWNLNLNSFDIEDEQPIKFRKFREE